MRLPLRFSTAAICTLVLFSAAAFASEAASLDQCRNGSFSNQVECKQAAWVNGNAGASNAHYHEGETIAYRMLLTGLTPGNHTLVIEWDITKNSRYAIDYLTSVDRTPSPTSAASSNETYPWTHNVDRAEACLGAAPGFDAGLCGDSADSSNPNLYKIPLNSSTADGAIPPAMRPFVNAATPAAQDNMYMYCQGCATQSTAPTIKYLHNFTDSPATNFTSFAGTLSQDLTINFTTTASQTTVLLAWGGHISRRQEWGSAAVQGAGFPFTGTASNVSGSPYHTRLISLDGSGGNQDRSLAAAAVQIVGSITIGKIITDPASDTTTSFDFSLTSPCPTSFSLTNGSTTECDTSAFGSYTATESSKTGWVLDTSHGSGGTGCPSSGIECSIGLTSLSGTTSFTCSGRHVDITLQSGDDAICTFYNKSNPPHLTIAKTPDKAGDAGYEIHPGGNAVFTITVTNDGGADANGVIITDPLPDTAHLTWTPSDTTHCIVVSGALHCGDATAISNGKIAFSALAAGSSITITLTAAIPAGYLSPPAGSGGNSASLFEIDGNLAVNTAGDKDWANIGIDCTTTNKGCALDKPTGKNDDSFGQGTAEDDATPSVVNGSIPNNKSDLSRFYLATEKITTTDNTDYLYLAWERVQNPKGTTNMDFELNQSSTISSNGVTPMRTAGDLLISYDLDSGGTVPTIGYHIWVVSNASPASSICEASSSYPCWDKYHALSAASGTAGAVNTASVSDPVMATGQTVARSLDAFTFGEAKINLQLSGIFAGATGCESFGKAYLKSRSSSSFNSEIKDFIAPMDVLVSNCSPMLLNNTATTSATSVSATSDSGQIDVTPQ